MLPRMHPMLVRVMVLVLESPFQEGENLQSLRSDKSWPITAETWEVQCLVLRMPKQAHGCHHQAKDPWGKGKRCYASWVVFDSLSKHCALAWSCPTESVLCRQCQDYLPSYYILGTFKNLGECSMLCAGTLTCKAGCTAWRKEITVTIWLPLLEGNRSIHK